MPLSTPQRPFLDLKQGGRKSSAKLQIWPGVWGAHNRAFGVHIPKVIKSVINELLMGETITKFLTSKKPKLCNSNPPHYEDAASSCKPGIWGAKLET